MVDLIILILGIPKQKKEKKEKSAFQGKEKTLTCPPRSWELTFFAQYPLTYSLLSALFSNSYSFTLISILFLQLQNSGFFSFKCSKISVFG